MSRAHVAIGGIHCGEVLEEPLELANLVEVADLVEATDVSSSDEDARQGEVGVEVGPVAAHYPVELVGEGGVHRDVAVVDSDAEGA